MKIVLTLLAIVAVSIPCVLGQSHVDRLVAQLLLQLGRTGSIAWPVPRGNESRPVGLTLGLSLLRLTLLMNGDSSGELDVWLKMLWKDPRLTWDPAQYGGLRQVALPSNLLWTPDIRSYRAGKYELDTVSPVRIVVQSTSDIIYVLPAKLRARCDRLRSGRVRCRAVLGSWVHSSRELNTTLSQDPLNMDDFEQLDDWRVDHASARRLEKFYPCCPESYVSAEYTIVLGRKKYRQTGLPFWSELDD